MFRVYGVLLKKGERRVKCKTCGGEGTVTIQGSLKVCRPCDGQGIVAQFKEAEKVLRQFQLSPRFVLKAYSSMLMFSDPEDTLRTLQAFKVSGIKATLVFPLLA